MWLGMASVIDSTSVRDTKDLSVGTVNNHSFNGEASDRRLVMRDVSDYANKVGLDYTVLISPNILFDLKDIPVRFQLTTDQSRLMGILESVRTAMKSLTHEEREQVAIEHKFVLCKPLMAVGPDGRDGVYKVYARFSDDGSVELVTPSERTSITTTPEIIERVDKTKLSPPKLWWKPEIN